MLEYALKYAQLGWHVFPCVPREKRPLTMHGVHDATTDYARIRKWWGSTASANIAVACGDKSGLFVVDVDIDPDKGIDGFESLKEFPSLPETVRQDTPRGGFHALFAASVPPANKNGFRTGIDIRGNGFYIVLAPSIHPNGGRYSWAAGLSPWEVDQAVFPDFMRPSVKAATARQHSPAPAADIDSSEVMRRAGAYLLSCGPAVQGCAGHSRLLWAAVAMVHGFLLTDDQAFSLLASTYNPACIPPWDLDDPNELKDFKRKIAEAGKIPHKNNSGWLLHDAEYAAPAPLMGAKQVQSFIQNSLPIDQQGVAPKSAPPEIKSVTKAEIEFLTRPAGFAGDLCGWINSTSIRKQPLLTLGCVLSFCGALFGRKIKIGRLRSNLYCMGVAQSSAGKGHAPEQIRRLCLAAGCDSLLGGDSWTSDAAIEVRLEKSPATLFLCDEIGHFLSGAKATPYGAIRTVIPALMKLYSMAGSVYVGKEYAQSENRRTIIQPCCCLYGTSTPSRFFPGLSTKEFEDGWLSRCLVFLADDMPSKERTQAAASDIPDHLTETTFAWFARRIRFEDEAELCAFTQAQLGGKVVERIDLLDVAVTMEAEEIFRKFDLRSEGMNAANARGIGSLWLKAEENARKIALIIAAGKCFDDPVVAVEDADYSCRLISYLINDFAPRAELVSDNETGSKKIKLIEAIRAFGSMGCQNRQITRKTQWCKQRERRELLEDLVQGGQIAIETSGKTVTYRYVDSDE